MNCVIITEWLGTIPQKFNPRSRVCKLEEDGSLTVHNLNGTISGTQGCIVIDRTPESEAWCKENIAETAYTTNYQVGMGLNL